MEKSISSNDVSIFDGFRGTAAGVLKLFYVNLTFIFYHKLFLVCCPFSYK